MRRTSFAAAVLLITAWTAAAQAPPVLSAGSLPRQWRPAGPKCAKVPDWEIREYNKDLVILRQSGCTNFEKPFLYLLFGKSKVLLFDSGAGNVDVAGPVKKLIDAHRKRTGGPVLPLVVAHSHAHPDHIAGDAELASLPNTTVVAPRVDAVKTFFGITSWPTHVGTFDLGDRILDVIPIPGHEPSSIALYDRQTGILLTGDTLYPGRLYVPDQTAYAESIGRLVTFTATRPVAHILGAHIEQRATPFADYEVGTVFQPDEHVLELGRAHLLELSAAVKAMTPGAFVETSLRDFTIVPIP